MSELQTIITQVSSLVGLDKDNFITKITEWNKNKVYPVSLIEIDISANGVKDNADQIGEIVAKIGNFVDDTVKNALDAESVLDVKKTVGEISKYFEETRKIQTNPLKEVAGHFTPHEAKLKEYGKLLTDKADEINEKDYQVAEDAIKEHLEALLKDEGMDGTIGLDHFKDFIANKRKTKVFTSTKALDKKTKDAIAEVVRIVVDPIKAERALEEKRSLQSKQFESYLDNIPADGTNEILESSIISLRKLAGSVDDLYPDVADACKRSIDNKIARCEANIRTNSVQAEVEAFKNADVQVMATYNDIRSRSLDMTLGSTEIEAMVKELRVAYELATFSDNKEKIKVLGAGLQARFSDMKAREIAPKREEPKVEDPTDKDVYLVALEDFEVLAGMEIQAGSQDEAKRELVRRFEAHLTMIDLVKKGA